MYGTVSGESIFYGINTLDLQSGNLIPINRSDFSCLCDFRSQFFKSNALKTTN